MKNKQNHFLEEWSRAIWILQVRVKRKKTNWKMPFTFTQPSKSYSQYIPYIDPIFANCSPTHSWSTSIKSKSLLIKAQREGERERVSEWVMGGSSGLVDWRGRPVNTKKHGGVRASIFIHGMSAVLACGLLFFWFTPTIQTAWPVSFHWCIKRSVPAHRF